MANGNAPQNASSQGDGLLFGQTSAHTFSMLEAVMTETLGMSMHNAVRAQNGMQTVSSAAVVAACARMLNATPPAPPAPPPGPVPITPVTPTAPGGNAASIAKDTVRADTAVGALVQDAEAASANVTSATAALDAIVKQAQAGIPSTPPASAPTPPDAPTPPAGTP